MGLRSTLPTRRLASGLASAWAMLPAAAPWVAIVATAATLGIGWHWSTRAVGGSDSHCYVGQARMFADGRLSLDPPFSGPVPWPNAPATFAPAGFIAKPTLTGESVPICPAGLSLMMAAAFRTTGEWGVFLIVPLLGGLAIWCTYLLGRRLDGPVTGAVAAIWLACSPIALYQLVQPMSDVPAMALWTAALACAVGRRRPVAVGALGRRSHHDAAEPGSARGRCRPAAGLVPRRLTGTLERLRC